VGSGWYGSREVLAVAKVYANGRIVLPGVVRRMLGVSDGDRVVFVAEDGRIVVEPARVGRAFREYARQRKREALAYN